MNRVSRTIFTATSCFVIGSLLSGYVVWQTCRADSGDHAISIPSHIVIEKAFNKDNVVDVAIVGSGPAGLSSALYASRLGRKCVVIQGNNQGGQLMGTSYVENWPGIKKIMGPDLIAGLREQAAEFGPIFLNDSIDHVDFSQWPYVMYTENGLKIHALSVIIATGASPRLLCIEGEQDYWGRGVTTCAVCDAPFYKGEEVVVVGGGDSAIEEAIQLASYARKITILVRGNKMRATPVMQAHLAGYNNIEVKYNAAIQKIVGDEEHVTSIELINPATKETSIMPISGVFLAIGHVPNTDMFKDNIKVSEHGYILLKGRSQETSKSGIFAAGDVEDDVYRQGGVAAGNGIKAAIDSDRFLAALGLDKQAQEKLSSHYFVGTERSKAELGHIETLEQYEQALGDGSIPMILDFYTQSCPSCMQMLPVLAEVAQQFEGKALFYKIDAENALELVEKFLVYKVPCLVVIKDSKLVARYNDAMGKKDLTELVEKAVAITK